MPGQRKYSFPTICNLVLGGGWLTPRPGQFTPKKDPGATVQEAVWDTGSLWTGAETLGPTWGRSPDSSVPGRQILIQLEFI
jgi:hypothetical protein